ncbi:MAG: metallophosphoesterase [Deltaproteobacteria bacterium]|nr:metallophosphoesterase [Deltaproteobacteria bacterium]
MTLKKPYLLLPALAVLACVAAVAGCPESPSNPDTTATCPYTGPGIASCCNAGAGCSGDLSCNKYTCSCDDVVDPCGLLASDAGVVIGPVADAGTAPTGTVTSTGGTVDRLWFVATGDTRPGDCDDTANYPRAAINQIATVAKDLKAQFVLDLGDHMYVCNGDFAEAQTQMGYYTSAMALGPDTWFLTMGNHECGRFRSGGSGSATGCFGKVADSNFDTFMAATGRSKPWYNIDIQTSKGLARIVVIANDSWDTDQKAWLIDTLTDADANAKYTIISRHQPFTGSRVGQQEIADIVLAHKYTLLLTAHSHTYYHGTEYSGRSAVVGIGGAPTSSAYGFVSILQNNDANGSLTVQRRDINGNPIGTPWTVQPQ